MAGDLMAFHRKRNKMERKRKQKLLVKIQKAAVLKHVDEIFSLSSWGKRFRRTARLRLR